jgi:hypothetical protein
MGSRETQWTIKQSRFVLIVWEDGCTVLGGFDERIVEEIGLWTVGAPTIRQDEKRPKKRKNDSGKPGLKR